MTNSKLNGGKLSDILAELKSEYRQNFPKKVGQLRELTTQQNWLQLTQEFHKLKGTGRTYGFPEVSLLCEALEVYCLQGSVDATQIEKIFPVFARMQQAWEDGEPFNLQQDPEAHLLLALKGRTAFP